MMLNKVLASVAILSALAMSAMATDTYTKGPTISTVTKTVTSSMAGTQNYAASAASINTPTVIVNGSSGSVTAQVFAGTAAFRGPSPWVDVKAFGARMDGTTDDTAALVAAEAALPTTGGATGGGTLFIPPGTIRISCWRPTHHGLVIKGAGMTATRILGLGCNDGAMVKLNSISFGQMQDLTLDANDLSTTTLALNSSSSMGNWSFSNMYIRGASSTTITFDAEDGLSHEVSKIAFDKVYAYSSSTMTVGVLYIQGSNTQQITWKNGEIWGPGSQYNAASVYMAGGEISFWDTDFNNASTSSIL